MAFDMFMQPEFLGNKSSCTNLNGSSKEIIQYTFDMINNMYMLGRKLNIVCFPNPDQPNKNPPYWNTFKPTLKIN